jgi:hypothetical protein
MPALERLNQEMRENIEAHDDAQHYTIVPLGRIKPSSDFGNSTQSMKYLFQGMSHVVVSLLLDVPMQSEFKDLP